MKDDKLKKYIKNLKKSSREDAIFAIFSLVFAIVVYLTIQSLYAMIAGYFAIVAGIYYLYQAIHIWKIAKRYEFIREKIGRDKDGK